MLYIFNSLVDLGGDFSIDSLRTLKKSIFIFLNCFYLACTPKHMYHKLWHQRVLGSCSAFSLISHVTLGK